VTIQFQFFWGDTQFIGDVYYSLGLDAASDFYIGHAVNFCEKFGKNIGLNPDIWQEKANLLTRHNGEKPQETLGFLEKLSGFDKSIKILYPNPKNQ
jgi:hypothetical protein